MSFLKRWAAASFGFYGVGAFFNGWVRWSVSLKILLPFLFVSGFCLFVWLVARDASSRGKIERWESVTMSVSLTLMMIGALGGWIESFIVMGWLPRILNVASTAWLAYHFGWQQWAKGIREWWRVRPYDPDKHELRPVEDQV